MHRQENGGIDEVHRLYFRIFSDLPAGQRILEVGCGTGQVTVALAQMGHKVTGIDFSKKSLAVARQLAKKQNLNIQLECTDFLEREFKEKYDIAFVLSSFITHFLEDTELETCIEKIFNCLKPDGIAVIGIYDYGKLMIEEPDIALSNVAPVSREKGNILYFQRRIWQGSPRSPIHDCSYFVVPDKSMAPAKIISMKRRAITPAELSQRLCAAGFKQLKWFSPSEADYYQSVCLACRQKLKFNSIEIQDKQQEIDARNYLIWDGAQRHRLKIIEILKKDLKNTSLHFANIIDTEQQKSSNNDLLNSINNWISDIQSDLGGFEVSSSAVDRSNLSKLPPRIFAQAYLASQVIMSAYFSTSDMITIFISNRYDCSKEDSCRELIRAISRTEEIPNIVFIR